MNGLGRLAVLLAFLSSCGSVTPLGVDAGGGADAGGSRDAGDPCSTLPQQYADALMRAKQCSLSAGTACQMSADSSLQCPGCTTHVNDTTELAAIRAQYAAASCPPTPCPAIACVRPGVGTCQPADGGATGMCVDVF
jgi:hypothetical protein